MRALLLPLLTLAACGSMYGAPPERLHRVGKPIVHVDLPDPVKEVAYIDTCDASFHESAAKVRRAPTAAQRLVTTGNAKIDASLKQRDPHLRGDLFTDGVQQYRAALVQDPYDAEATVALARAYDDVYKKGCALKLLDRLALLAQNPKLSPKAPQLVQDVQNHNEWFKGYRTAAKDAVLGVRNP